MKLLFITTQFPYPLDNGGKKGAINGISVVSLNYDTMVLSFSEEQNYIEEGFEYFRDKYPNVCFAKPISQDIHIRKKPFKLIKAMVFDYLYGIPYVSSKFVNKEMFQTIDSIFSDNAYWDVVFIDYLNMAVYGKYIKKKYYRQFGKYVMKDHNIEYQIVKQEMEKSRGIKKIILQHEWIRTEKYERKAIAEADVAFSVCNENTKFLLEENTNSFTMLPVFHILPFKENIPEGHTILYMGNLSWGANMAGLKWFVKEVFPIVKSKYNDAVLTIIGSGSSKNPFIGSLGVNYRGYVKDISHVYDGQRVFIVPLFVGSGIRIKILDAFNNNIPVVSTTLGCGTIEAHNGSELFIADDAASFASSIMLLFDNSEIYQEIRKNARLFLNANYSLETISKEFVKAMDMAYK